MTSALTQFARLLILLALTSVGFNMKAETATNKILFDFQVASNSPVWEVVNDDVMGGVSTSQFQVLTNGCAVFSGTVQLDNNGGFASVRSAPMREDLAGYTAFVLQVRGDGRRYKFSVRTGTGFDTPLYQCSFTTKSGEWEEHRLAFSDFVPTFRGRVLTDVPPLNPTKVNSVGFLISDKQAGPFRLEIGWIKAAR
jgi:monofunctional biosynthetic peptidoglycan transglycosylase